MDPRQKPISILFEDMRRAFAEWNPIGVPYEKALGEYDAYVWQVISRLQRAESIRQYLTSVLVDQMGLSYDASNPDHHDDISDAIRKFEQIYRDWAGTHK